MSEFELIQVADMQLDRVMDGYMNFVTILFAYVVACFLVGKNLSRLIAIALTTIYSLAEFGPLLAVFIAVRGLTMTNERYLSNYPDGMISANSEIGTNFPLLFSVPIVPLIVGWTISVFYMHWYTRRPREKGSER